ncbi:hypothetical protein [Shewanella fidelis]|uniref:DUF4760 domain-containing protein n=1 Tax=Shewanella fidelis TaxID=173509 RepID=A0AAW8NR29_9GAMM|nr:hypothetical protein [Shewanella fidelis]MDR8525557.1 hypothetical protein [Shewanella fidelis]MDW4813124.1 hypothetical protein [Shewanella fidelis]MDW4816996.1 hypothetical protein [Shewanella fidelis]MDW4820155.1 hypothetical protein [Shewanella fidelis]MDW4825589.1 hypothetical protein [Shewanella fidelis]
MKTIFLISGSLLAVLFVMLGIAIGVSYDASTEETLVWIQALCSVGGVVIAASTMLIALYALRTWKSQFDHAEKFKAIVNLETQLRSLYQSFDKYIENHTKVTVYNHQQDCLGLSNNFNLEVAKFDGLMDFSLSFLSTYEQDKVNGLYENQKDIFRSAIELVNSHRSIEDSTEFENLIVEKDKEITQSYLCFKNLLRTLRR